VDIAALGDTISGLGEREFVLRRAGSDQPEVFTTRWAMSYLRGPMTRDQVDRLMNDQRVAAEITNAPAPSSGIAGQPTPVLGTAPIEPEVGDDESAVMPDVADGTPVRWADVAAPWLADAGGDPRGSRLAAAAVARVNLRYDETKADLVHDDEFECVLFPLDEHVDASRMIKVDYDDRDLRPSAPDAAIYRLTDAKLKNKTYWSSLNKAIRDELVRTATVEIQSNEELKIYGRPGEDAQAFNSRCLAVAEERADAEIAKLRDKYETKVERLRDQIETAEDRIDVLAEQSKGARNSELLSTAGSVLGGLLGGSKSKGGMLGGLFGKAGTAARRRGSTNAAEERVGAAENKLERLVDEVHELEAELADELIEIDERWTDLAQRTTTLDVGLEANDVNVVQLSATWIPVD